MCPATIPGPAKWSSHQLSPILLLHTTLFLLRWVHYCDAFQTTDRQAGRGEQLRQESHPANITRCCCCVDVAVGRHVRIAVARHGARNGGADAAFQRADGALHTLPARLWGCCTVYHDIRRFTAASGLRWLQATRLGGSLKLKISKAPPAKREGGAQARQGGEMLPSWALGSGPWPVWQRRRRLNGRHRSPSPCRPLPGQRERR